MNRATRERGIADLAVMSQAPRWQRAQKHELRWWRRYLRRKDAATYHAWKSGYWNRVLAMVPAESKPAPGERVLDLGCGPAGVFMVLDQQRVTAVDPLMEAYVRDGLLHPRAFPWVEFHPGTLEDMVDSVAEPGAFRTIFCMNVLNHVNDIEAGVKSLSALAAGCAHVILTIDAHRTTFLKQVLRLLPLDRLHPHQLSMADYERMFTAIGLSPVKATPIWKRGPMAHWLLVLKPGQK